MKPSGTPIQPRMPKKGQVMRSVSLLMLAWLPVGALFVQESRAEDYTRWHLPLSGSATCLPSQHPPVVSCTEKVPLGFSCVQMNIGGEFYAPSNEQRGGSYSTQRPSFFALRTAVMTASVERWYSWAICLIASARVTPLPWRVSRTYRNRASRSSFAFRPTGLGGASPAGDVQGPRMQAWVYLLFAGPEGCQQLAQAFPCPGLGICHPVVVPYQEFPNEIVRGGENRRSDPHGGQVGQTRALVVQVGAEVFIHHQAPGKPPIAPSTPGVARAGRSVRRPSPRRYRLGAPAPTP